MTRMGEGWAGSAGAARRPCYAVFSFFNSGAHGAARARCSLSFFSVRAKLPSHARPSPRTRARLHDRSYTRTRATAGTRTEFTLCDTAHSRSPILFSLMQNNPAGPAPPAPGGAAQQVCERLDRILVVKGVKEGLWARQALCGRE